MGSQPRKQQCGQLQVVAPPRVLISSSIFDEKRMRYYIPFNVHLPPPLVDKHARDAFIEASTKKQEETQISEQPTQPPTRKKLFFSAGALERVAVATVVASSTSSCVVDLFSKDWIGYTVGAIVLVAAALCATAKHLIDRNHERKERLKEPEQLKKEA